MATSDRGGDFDAACRALEAALRARLGVTSARIRLHTRDRTSSTTERATRAGSMVEGRSRCWSAMPWASSARST